MKKVFLLSFVLLVWCLNSYAQTYTWTCPTTIAAWTVPAGVTSVNVDLQGAVGGLNTLEDNPYYYAGYFYVAVDSGGPGGRVQATLAVTPGQVLNIYVGGTAASPVIGSVTAGGFNGGGTGEKIGALYVFDGFAGGGGGGASDIRIGGTALANRVVVAGGGGGADGGG